MTGTPLELFRKFFGAVRAIFGLWGSFLAPDVYHVQQDVSMTSCDLSRPKNAQEKARKHHTTCVLESLKLGVKSLCLDCETKTLLLGQF